MSITEFFLWLAGGLGSSVTFSYIAERLEWFQKLDVDAKKVWATVGSSVIAILAYVIYTYVPSEVWVVLSPYWQLIVAVISVNYGTQVFHKYDKTLPK